MPTYGTLQTMVRVGPQCSIEILNPSSNFRSCKLDAVIDSGAVMTCIPSSHLQRIGNLISGEDVILSDANGHKIRQETYYIHLDFLDFKASIEQIRVISLPGKSYALIGRDILNRYKLAFNGKRKLWALECGPDFECPNSVD